MPTGYTAKLCEGKQTFEEFTMECARAFGALITLRDSANAVIPNEFKPSNHHMKRITEAEKELAKFGVMTTDRAERLAILEFKKALKAHHEERAKSKALRDRLSAMADSVKGWIPPTSEHEGLKNFMLEQLKTTADFDGRDWGDEPVLSSGVDWRLNRIEQAHKDIAYHSAEYKNEVERCRSRSEWVQALRGSLKARAQKELAARR